MLGPIACQAVSAAVSRRAQRPQRLRATNLDRLVGELEALGCIEPRPGADGAIHYYTTPLGEALLEAP